MAKRDPLSPIKVPESVEIPAVWISVLGLVAVGAVIHIFFSILSSGGMLIWPFVFSLSVLLIVNDATDRYGAGVSPIHAYALFVGILTVFSIFVFLVSTINLWLLILLIIGAGWCLVREWKHRRIVQQEIQRRRLAGVCIRCREPVGDDLDSACPKCFLPVFPERLRLARLGKAIATQARAAHTRQTLTGSGPTRAATHLKNLQQQRAYRYKKGK